MQTIKMTLGELSGKTSEVIIKAGMDAIAQGFTQYSAVEGLFDLREAIAKHYSPDQADIGPERVMITPGVRQAVFNALTNLLQPNDEVILPVPYWFSFPDLIEAAKGKVVPLHTSAADNYAISAKHLTSCITPKTRMLIFNNPCNPSGRVYSEAEIDEIVAVIEKHPNVYVLSDEIYEFINFGHEFKSMGSWQAIADRVITISGFSKAFSMSGWRVGYIVASENLIQKFRRYQQTTLAGVSIFTQKAALAALQNKENYLPNLLECLHDKVVMGAEIMNSIPLVSCAIPQGSYYLFPDVSAYFGKQSPKGWLIANAGSMAAYLYANAGVQVFAGDMFGEPKCLRISLVLDKELMLEGLQRIKKAIEELS
jgi:aspartate aminotransferase